MGLKLVRNAHSRCDGLSVDCIGMDYGAEDLHGKDISVRNYDHTWNEKKLLAVIMLDKIKLNKLYDRVRWD